MKTEIKYAVIFVVASFLSSCLEYATGLHSVYIKYHPFFVTPFYILLTILIYLFALREKRASLGGRITFGKAFITGIILSVFIIILNPAFLYIFSHYINPDFFNAFTQNEIQSGKSTRQEAEEYFNFNNFLLRGSIYRFIMGIVATLVISAFMKKDVSKK